MTAIRDLQRLVLRQEELIMDRETRIAELKAQLPESMQECTIRFVACPVGHGMLTATNWAQHGCPWCRINKQEEALQKIKSWAEAYPLDVFPEPDMAYARALLARGGITLNSVSASCMRHVVEGVGKIACEALEPEPQK